MLTSFLLYILRGTVFNDYRHQNFESQMEWIRKDPFAFWQDKNVYRRIDDLNVNEEDIARAIDWNEKEPACRAQNLVTKVLRGQPIKMIVMGGSNSAGGGVSNHMRLYHQLFSQWWNSVIFPQTRSKLTVENLSLGGTGSDFFTFCFQNFVTQNGQPDIVLVELSVNDYGYLHGATAKPMELLTRRVLSFQTLPLVLYVSLVDLVKKSESLESIDNPNCHNLEDLGQRELAKHYEITLLSWRDILCPVNRKTRRRQPYLRPGMVNKDHLHIDVKGHAQTALMMIRYFQNSLERAAVSASYGLQPQCANPGLSPPLYADASSLVSNPLCWAYVNPRWGKSNVFQTLQVTVKRKEKFEELPLENVEANVGYNNDKDDRSDAFGGWRSARAGSVIEFSFQVPAATNYNGYVSNSYSLGMVIRRLTQNSGQVKMWLDNSKKAAVTIVGKRFGRVHFQTRVYFVDSNVLPGHHTLRLETTGNKAIGLLVSGIVLGPSGIRGFKGYKPTGTLEKVWSREDYEKFKI